ncbi:2-polyprenyl-6-methoxyphenol hydroxylase-like FAD-dependent oxidoreductase [Amycolatopsis thermoflava]|uniref:2-polyprenyl-6-methoxyphenol hydroxylase-like FAD-dependent oxidoreductase n=1 Tax=Amycolatopsis thermoflava TaxID=84480 RepID=A0A3N2GYA8_9PSEU|nr:FAD-dependent monooxygenase [Amycolatopsis thermoflava]ROS41642.1 2-polyprenyl-6-methoxyphenol hydroxylase-like FAD-dependent oxidoreductase [Amycolatopsis thermoflava]
MNNTKVLISGASIAGPALAHWLTRYGFSVTVVERAPGPRPGGQAVDVRGPALDVAERMGILDQLRARSTRMRGMSVVDGTGAEVYRTTDRTVSGGELDNPDVEILRDDLARIITESVGGDVEYLFGDSIAKLDQDDDEVRVVFESGRARTFDLVVGADGLHSNTRRLVFGPTERFIRHLGVHMAVCTVPNFLGLDNWQVMHQMPDGDMRGAMVMSARDNTEARAYLMFGSAEPVDYDHRDVEGQKEIVARALAGDSWEMPRLLEHARAAADFHFDSAAQILLDSWSRGRVVLLGDAGYCGSPMSGQGTSLAMIGAYVLAGELAAAGGDHRAAFAAYEKELRDYARANQEMAVANLRERRAQAGQAADASAAAEVLVETGVADFAQVVASYPVKDY